jgi:photosystem II stability/assembly factor-like uncharacterized protein
MAILERKVFRRIVSTLAAIFAVWPLIVAQPSTSGPDTARAGIVPTSARMWTDPTQFMMVDVTTAGSRIVSVGEHGVILLSDDDGATFRQAKSVPVDSTLTAVTFIDEKHGWAVGQWGVILATSDGGDVWDLMRVDTSVDQPLFSVAFKNAKVGWVAGLWSLLLKTEDGGKTWKAIELQPPPDGGKADRNLYKIWSGKDGILYIGAEHGTVLRSNDEGKTWVYIDTGYKGSFWTGMSTDNGLLYVAGLRGSLYRSNDKGTTWSRQESGVESSITGLAENGQQLVGVGLDGYWFEGKSDGSNFEGHQLADRDALTGIVKTRSGKFLLISKAGIRPTRELPFQ